MDPRRSVLLSTAVLLVAHGVHDLDHFRQGRSLEAPVLVLGGLAYVIVLAELLLVLRRSPAAPMGAIVVGLVTAIGFLAVHVVPDWGPLADGYPGADVDFASWAMVFIDIGVAGWVALSGWRAWLSERARST